MCLPHVAAEIEETLRRRDFLKFASAAAAAGLLGAGEAGAVPHPHPPDLDVELGARLDGAAIAFSVRLVNSHREAIGGVRLAGPIPAGTAFARVLEAPRGSRGRVEGSEVVWELPRVAPGGSAGPFRYEVRATGELALVEGHARVAWARPVAGAASSSTLTLVARAEAAQWKKVLDLSHTLSSATPIWPGFNPIQVQNLVTHDKDGFYGNQWTVHEHHGTHLDAPIHFAKGKWAADEIPEADLVCPAVVLHIHERARDNPDAQVTLDDVKKWEAKNGRIPRGAAVFMHSGWDGRIGDQNAYRNMDDKKVMHFPGFHPEAGEFLLKERQVRGVGVDTLSFDYGASKDFKVHLTLLPANKWGIENLANLAKLPEKGATVFVGLPKVKGASGGPTRVLAVW
jgi:kynurenine formamidase